MDRTVLKPVLVPCGGYCYNPDTGGHGPCGHFDSEGGHPTCGEGLGGLEYDKQGRVPKSRECLSLEVKHAN